MNPTAHSNKRFCNKIGLEIPHTHPDESHWVLVFYWEFLIGFHLDVPNRVNLATMKTYLSYHVHDKPS